MALFPVVMTIVEHETDINGDAYTVEYSRRATNKREYIDIINFEESIICDDNDRISFRNNVNDVMQSLNTARFLGFGMFEDSPYATEYHFQAM